MMVLLQQPEYNCTIHLLIMASDDPDDSWGRYVKISTSCIFDPYPALYAWLQHILQSELPAEVTIDEEGRGMTLIAEEAGDDNITFTIKPWFRGPRKKPFLSVQIKRTALVNAFANGICQFVAREYAHEQWHTPGLHDLRDIAWDSLKTTHSRGL